MLVMLILSQTEIDYRCPEMKMCLCELKSGSRELKSE